MEMGIELELGVLLVLVLLGSEIFGRFEIETPLLKRLLKWSVVISLTLGMYPLIGHWALMVAVIPSLIGITYHMTWCRRNGIHPFKATPRRRYYELRGWNPDEPRHGSSKSGKIR